MLLSNFEFDFWLSFFPIYFLFIGTAFCWVYWTWIWAFSGIGSFPSFSSFAGNIFQTILWMCHFHCNSKWKFELIVVIKIQSERTAHCISHLNYKLQSTYLLPHILVPWSPLTASSASPPEDISTKPNPGGLWAIHTFNTWAWPIHLKNFWVVAPTLPILKTHPLSGLGHSRC